MELPIVFLLVFTRVFSVVMTAPILGSRSVPFKIRLLVSGFISLATMSLIGDQASVPVDPAEIINSVFAEAVIGIILGLGVAIMFAAAQAAGTVIGQIAGLHWPSQTDSDGDTTTPVSQLFAVISLAAFALIGGPEMVIGAVLDTFVHLPLGTSLQSTEIISLVAELLQQSFLLTLRGVGPALTALMISTIVIGLVSRTYPQMNMLGIGLNSNQFVLFLAVFLTLGGCVWLFVDDLGSVVAMIRSTIFELHDTSAQAIKFQSVDIPGANQSRVQVNKFIQPHRRVVKRRVAMVILRPARNSRPPSKWLAQSLLLTCCLGNWETG